MKSSILNISTELKWGLTIVFIVWPICLLAILVNMLVSYKIYLLYC